MASVIIPRGPKPDRDEEFTAILGALERYAADHPEAVVEAYRHGTYAVRVRVTSPAFAGRPWADRDEDVWAYLRDLPEEVLWDLHILICVTPEEVKRNLGSLDFDDPLPAVG
jgi:stress-induced morphogen